MREEDSANGDTRMLTFIYGKNVKQKPFSLDACGFFNVGRPTVPAVSHLTVNHPDTDAKVKARSELRKISKIV